MLKILAEIFDNGGKLIAVTYTLFEDDRRFITAIGLQFESLSANFRAIPDNDTLAASLTLIEPGPEETLLEATTLVPWQECIGASVCWAWQLTNQQGYPDGVRIEFGKRSGESLIVVELIVMASALQLYKAIPIR